MLEDVERRQPLANLTILKRLEGHQLAMPDKKFMAN